jgi:CHAD domain-containing protein
MALDVNKIQKPMRKIRKLLNEASDPPTPDEVHDLRTASRKLETSVQAMSLDSRRNEKRVLKRMGRLRKRAGKVRDMDVLIGYASTVPANGDDDCRLQLLAHLGAKRDKSANKLHAIMRQYAARLRPRLKRTSARVEKVLDGKSKPPNAKPAPAEVAASVLQLSSDLASPKRLGRTNLHPYRLKVKELRNLLQIADNPTQPALVDQLSEVKDAIGEWHDWEELIAFATDVLDHKPACPLMSQLKRISNTKFEHALKLTETLRKKSLGTSKSKRKRGLSARANGAAEPILVAT